MQVNDGRVFAPSFFYREKKFPFRVEKMGLYDNTGNGNLTKTRGAICV